MSAYQQATGKTRMTNQLKQILEMANNKVNFFAIIECAESIGFELESRSMPGLKSELESLIALSEMNEEAETLTVTF